MPRTRKRFPYKLGCHLTPHTPHLRFGDYFDSTAQLPTPPAEFGHDDLITDWGVLGNDTVGDCAIAGPFHAEMLFCAEGKQTININTDCALKAYSAITGYDPTQTDDNGNNPTDCGSDPHDVALYWQRHGLMDADGTAHRIAAFIDLTPGNLTELWLATYLFDGVGVCINMPNQWMQSFQDGQPWDALPDPDVEGGHYVLGVSRRGGNLGIVTWGQVTYMTPAAYKQANVRTLAYLSEEMFINGVDLDGFSLDQLRADLRALPSAA